MKRYRIIQILTLVGVLLFSFQVGYSQNKHQLKGKVVASPYTQEPLSGAVVNVPGVQGSTQTDATGEFVLELPSLDMEIEVWAPGYHVYKQGIAGRSEVVVSLIPEDKHNYNEVLLMPMVRDVLQNKTTAINNISKANFSKGSISVEQAIHNALPGLQTITKSGMPGEGAYMNSRGVRSFVAPSAPLIVIDNVPYIADLSDSRIVDGYSSSVLNSLNPNDIQNITFLRGGDASIYGSLGSNGVLVIETDNAADQETKVQFMGQYGVARNNATLPVMGADLYKSYIGNIAMSKYFDPAEVLNVFPYLRDNPNYYYNYLYDNNTNWQDQIYSNAFVTDNVLKVKGGDAIAKYDLSMGYHNEEGVMKNTDFTRYHTRLNANINLSQNVDFFASALLSYSTKNLQEQGMTFQTNPILAALNKMPLKSPYQEDSFNQQLPGYSSIKDVNGNVIENDAVSNPLALVNSTKFATTSFDVTMNGGLNYHVSPDLKLTGMAGFFYNYDRTEAFIPGVTNKSIMPLAEGLAENTVRKGIKENINTYFNINGLWNKKIDYVHNLSASAGWQTLVTRRELDMGEGWNTPSDYYQGLSSVTSDGGRSIYGYIDLWNWMNFFGRVNYNYNNLLYAGVNFSVDGSSSVGPDATRFHLYPSINAAWNIKNMPGLANSLTLNRLTLRTEYSNTGNSNYSSTLSQYYYVNQPFESVSGIVRSGVANTGITPETTSSWNVGLDAALFNNAVDLTVDAYRSRTENVILDKAISPVFGFPMMYDNAAKIQNTGVEVGLQAYLYKNRDFKFLVGGTIARNKNEIIDLGGESDKIIEFSDGAALVNRKNESAYNFYGYKTNGIYATTQDAVNDGLTHLGVPFNAGDVRFVDINNDGAINENDRVILGNASPDFFGRLYASVGYKKFTLTANFAYSQGNDAYNAVRRDGESVSSFGNQLISANRRWTSQGQVTDMPKAVYGDPMQNNRFSDRWIEDASFIRLKELTLSYNFDNSLVSFIQGGTFYVSGENLITWTKYLGLDPEFSYSYDPAMQGFDYAKLAQPMTVKFGVNLQF